MNQFRDTTDAQLAEELAVLRDDRMQLTGNVHNIDLLNEVRRRLLEQLPYAIPATDRTITIQCGDQIAISVR